MILKTVIIATLLNLGLVNGLECGKHDILKKYRLNPGAITGSVERDTPPSKTKEEWWFDPCEDSGVTVPSGCDEKDTLCGVTYVTLPGKDALLTQAIDFSREINNAVEEIDGKLRVSLLGSKWGADTFNAQIDFECDTNMKNDEITSNTWQDKQIRLNVKGPSGCLKDDNGGNDDKAPSGKHPQDDKKDKKKGTSWFTWLLTYAMLFTLIYLIVTAYVNTRGGSYQDFREEFIERLMQLVTSLPAFVKEVTSKIFGGSSSHRGGYSAV
ncbi:Atg27p TDEL_0G01990 [Torulaspora delbrueckii]|uniref:Autophagy-related protein 27 n=1 Tax=Torulaspora delbrueckii TaxID=4950 RepID=G8ZYU1_TORDE|nr:hypothetical protein TDEL_0G01990 [Torulaspora delbrueckii]CCE93566.1 hypothetical protein TDEL_0G01990 [Torulaspora delbrueckii]